jgi:tight adherence protein C
MTQNQQDDDNFLLLFRTLGELVLSAMPGLADKRTVQLLIEGNYRNPAHLPIYTGIKFSFAAVCVFGALLVNVGSVFGILLCLPAALLGWLVPNFILAGQVKARQNEILSELPIMIDLLTVSTQSGLGLFAAMDKLRREAGDSCPILAIEFEELIRDVRISATRVPVEMRDMGERCGVYELIALSDSLILAEERGVDISYALRQEGDALRARLKRYNQDAARKTLVIKMVPVIMIFLLPLILAPMLGPAFVTLLLAMGPIMDGR